MNCYPAGMRLTILAMSALLLVLGCGRPPFEQFETRISATLIDAKTGAPKRDDTGQVIVYSAVLKGYINNRDNSVNFELTQPSPSWTLNCDECKAALFAEARRVTEAAYPHL
ncbi:MAG: hypothetical protein RIS86_1733, partial [Planctomycetota bacterium]